MFAHLYISIDVSKPLYIHTCRCVYTYVYMLMCVYMQYDYMPGLEACGLPESSYLTSIGGLRLAKPDSHMREETLQSRTRVELYLRV